MIPFRNGSLICAGVLGFVAAGVLSSTEPAYGVLLALAAAALCIGVYLATVNLLRYPA
jgi:hypothetical protein